MSYWEIYKARREEFTEGNYVVIADNGIVEGKTPHEASIKAREQGIKGNSRAFQVGENDILYHEARESANSTLELTPDEQSQLTSLLRSIEERLKKPVELTLKSPVMKPLTLCPLTERPFTVYAAKTSYKEIEGHYSSASAIEERLKKLKSISIEPCPDCGHVPGQIRVVSMDAPHKPCPNQHSHFSFLDNKWSWVSVNTSMGKLYVSGGGSVSICETIALIKFE